MRPEHAQHRDGEAALHGLPDMPGCRVGDVGPAVEGRMRVGGRRCFIQRCSHPLSAAVGSPRRTRTPIFNAVKDVIATAGALIEKTRRALDSTALDDAVATQDIVTQLVAAIGRSPGLCPVPMGSSPLAPAPTTTRSPGSRTSPGTLRRSGRR